MGNFNRRDGRDGDRGGFRPGGNRPVTMHKAICSNCGQSCEVPFRPTGEKPVYCNNCFGKVRDTEGRGGRDDRGRGDRRDFGGGNADIVRQLESVNSKLDRLIRALEKPVEVAQPKTVNPGSLKQAVKKATDSKKKK